MIQDIGTFIESRIEYGGIFVRLSENLIHEHWIPAEIAGNQGAGMLAMGVIGCKSIG